MNQAAIEIAAILLRFEIERIERQKTAAASQTLAGENAATATDQPQKVNRPAHGTSQRRARQPEA